MVSERVWLRREQARFINSAAYATRCASKPGYDKEGCKRTAHDFIVKAIATRERFKTVKG
jgi:hypothetical protein